LVTVIGVFLYTIPHEGLGQYLKAHPGSIAIQVKLNCVLAPRFLNSAFRFDVRMGEVMPRLQQFLMQYPRPDFVCWLSHGNPGYLHGIDAEASGPPHVHDFSLMPLPDEKLNALRGPLKLKAQKIKEAFPEVKKQTSRDGVVGAKRSPFNNNMGVPCYINMDHVAKLLGFVGARVIHIVACNFGKIATPPPSTPLQYRDANAPFALARRIAANARLPLYAAVMTFTASPTPKPRPQDVGRPEIDEQRLLISQSGVTLADPNTVRAQLAAELAQRMRQLILLERVLGRHNAQGARDVITQFLR
jgi:hypothetical protein